MMDLRKLYALMLILAFVVTGCGGGGDEDLNSTQKGGAPAAQMGTASISGKVTLSGKAPSMPNIAFDADSTCKSQHPTAVKDQMVEADAKGDLADVFVYVKDGAGSYPAPSTPVTLIQKGCMYSPHVFGIQVNQSLEIVNGDPTLHNVHAMANINDPFNLGQPTQGMTSEKKLSKAEVPLRFKCDVHSWMHCMAGVVTNPFFSVSGADGTFKVSQLPAGSYTLVAYQEKYGESAPQKVDIKDGEAKTINFTFTAQ
jgi:hypothetical protein